MSDRELVIVHLLENLGAYADPQQSRSASGDGVALPLLPLTYSRSVRQVELLLARMREDRVSSLVVLPGGEKVSVRQLWWHLRAWYVDCDRSPVVPRRVKVPRSKGRKLVRLAVDSSGRALPVRRVVRARGARLEVAEAGVRWLAANWPAGWEPARPFVHGTPSGRRFGCECAECLAAGKAGKRVAA